jgi:hypothetical protein
VEVETSDETDSGRAGPHHRAPLAADRDNAEALLDIGSGRTVLYVDVVEAHVTVAGADPDDVGAVEVVRPQDYAGARPDPLSGTEAALLGHLVAGHPGELRRLAELVPAELVPVELRAGAVPVALDRYGLVLRCGTEDVRLPFGAPVHCPRELPARMRELLTRTAVAADQTDTGLSSTGRARWFSIEPSRATASNGTRAVCPTTASPRGRPLTPLTPPRSMPIDPGSTGPPSTG